LDKGLSISYTQWEAWLALYHGKKLIVARPTEGAPRGPNYSPTEASRAAQQFHLARLKELDRHPIIFENATDLARQVLSSTVLDILIDEELKRRLRQSRALLYPTLAAALLFVLLIPIAADELVKTLGWLAAPLSIAISIGGLAFLPNVAEFNRSCDVRSLANAPDQDRSIVVVADEMIAVGRKNDVRASGP
jgi:hypothetical protein